MAGTVTSTLNTSMDKHHHDDYVELMPTWGYAASAFALFLIGFFGFFLNLMVIILMCKDKQLWTPLNLILFNLVCSDFSVSILGNPFALISALSHRWVFGKTMCVVYGFFMTLLGITSITTLTVLSFERYIMVSRPLTSNRLSMRGASCSICLIWCYSIIVTTPPLFGWGRYVNEAANISCSINWDEQTLNALTYILFLFAMGLIFPVIIITFSYLNILKTMRKNALRVGRVQKAESRVTLLVFIMILTFMIAWTPYSVLALMEQFAPQDLISPGLGVIPALVAKSSICYDPIIYVGMNTQFRTSVKRIFGFGDKDDSIQERGLENTLMSPTRGVSHINDNNVTLQYLNPNNNTVVAVTIYRDKESEFKRKNDKLKDDGFTKKNFAKKKKISLVSNSLEEESSELSEESRIHSSADNTKVIIPVKSNAIDLEHANDAFEIITNFEEKLSKQCKKFDDEIYKESEEEMNKFKGKDLLLKATNNASTSKKINGVDNLASIWDEADAKGLVEKDLNYVRKNVENEETHTRLAVPFRRKSMAVAHSRPEFIDANRIRDVVNRRKSSTNIILPGQFRKFSSAFESKGLVTTRLMVDERDKSKLMSFEGKKANRRPNNEQLL